MKNIDTLYDLHESILLDVFRWEQKVRILLVSKTKTCSQC